MVRKFLKYIKDNNMPLPEYNEHVLLAVSGGLDSVVLTDLFYRAGYKFSIAHVNFGLRNDESEKDQKFVENIALSYNMEFFCRKFDTIATATKHKLSIQMAARKLRFDWFNELCDKHGFKYIATAHHSDDQTETFIINLLRGSSIPGLGGIKPVSGRVIHPLLFASRNSILNYARKNKLVFREDSSNSSEKYLRNKVRISVIPMLEKTYPGAVNSLLSSQEKISDICEVMTNSAKGAAENCVIQHSNFVEIKINPLRELKPLKPYLYEFIKPYGFHYNIINDIISCLNAFPGKQFYSATHRLVIDRENLIITELSKSSDEIKEVFNISRSENFCDFKTFSMEFSLFDKPSDFIIPEDSCYAYLDYEKLVFPLIVRKWAKGDKFYPLGMKKPKKISDFLVDKKIPLTFKDNVYLLCSGENIVWVIGMRIDERYKLKNTSMIIYKCKIR